MTNEEFDEILERTNAVVCNREWYERAVKALEQQPSDNCVSRQAMLKEIPRLWNSKGDKDYCMETLRDFVTELPPVTPIQKWIPVSERLPKEGETVLVCYQAQGKIAQSVCEWFDMPNRGIVWSTLCGRTPIAWMPLPKQYKAEMESNACKDCYYNDGEVHAECVVCGAEMESEQLLSYVDQDTIMPAT